MIGGMSKPNSSGYLEEMTAEDLAALHPEVVVLPLGSTEPHGTALPVAVRQWVVVFPKRVRYFVNIDAGCLNRVAGIVMREVQRATAGASTSTAPAARSGGVLFVHRFGAALNAYVHLHLCVLDGVVAQGQSGLVFRGAQVDEACVERVRMQSRLRNWSLIRPWGCKAALRKWHMRRGVGGCGSGAGRVR